MEDEILRNAIQNAQSDFHSFNMLRRHAVGILTHLGVPDTDADRWVLESFRDKKIKDLAKWESELHENLDSLGIYPNLEKRMHERARLTFDAVKPHLRKTKTLDLGGGSGEIAKMMEDFGCNVSVADVIDWRKVDIPFVKVKDNIVDAKDGEFDQVVLLTVFHHTDDVKALVSDAFRVAKSRVIFVESVTEDIVGYMYGAWIDWFYNRVIHYSDDPKKKINVPLNFLPSAGWEQLVWKLTGLKPKHSIKLGIFQFLNPENHHLFVYDK